MKRDNVLSKIRSAVVPVFLICFVILISGCPNPPGLSDSGGKKPSVGDGKTDAGNNGTEGSDPEEAKPLTKTQLMILKVTQSEHLLQSLSSKFKKLAKSFKDDSIDVSEFAGDSVEYEHGIAEQNFNALIQKQLAQLDDFASVFYWPLDESTTKVQFKDIWNPITADYKFEDAQFGTTKAFFPVFEDKTRFITETKFEGRIRTADDALVGIKGKQVLTWQEVSDNDWRIVGWKQKELKLIAAPVPLFSNVTRKLFPDEETYKKISRSSHQEVIVKRAGEANIKMSIRDVRDDYPAFSDWESTGQYPNVSVVDYDLDGDDDIFITDRWQSPQLLRNNGDQTFEDVTADSGLEFDDFVNCGYFFDFDNDGDADLLVGYSVKPSRFFENKGGTFVPHEKINAVLADARVVVSAAAADINHDGLLDLYLCTYSSATGPIDTWIEHVARPEDRVRTRLRVERADKFVDRGGPPNIMLFNRGDTFEWAKIDNTLKQYRSSYQASWMDFDHDGDPDLYVCNDFSPDVFLRNDTEQGSFVPNFVDVTSEVAPSVQMGFGMGTSYGDFDNDADLDLYVCNMYSKAGTRIIAQLENVDERLAVSARGNFLYENQGKTFRQIAGDGPDQQHINVVGWSFGGQFADFDNDGHLDLYVPSGFYSAPKEVNTDLDL